MNPTMQKNFLFNVIEPENLTRRFLDKGYDSEDIHELIRDDLNSYSLIPVRSRQRKRISEFCRREFSRSFDQMQYHRRNLVETVFSVLKRKFGEALKARNYRNQIKELEIKMTFTISQKLFSCSFSGL